MLKYATDTAAQDQYVNAKYAKLNSCLFEMFSFKPFFLFFCESNNSFFFLFLFAFYTIVHINSITAI